MANLAQHIWAWEHGQDRPEIDLRPADWDSVLTMLARAVAVRPAVVILDELPYLIESDSAFVSYLQAAWDHQFKNSNVKLLLSGSHMGMMTRLLEYHAPLYGRFQHNYRFNPWLLRILNTFSQTMMFRNV